MEEGIRSERPAVPRGRHAPPLEVRRDVQRERLFEAAARVFARVGYAESSAETVAREAGMSKATFYEHFANKEECILALFDRAADEVLGALVEAARQAPADPVERIRSGTRAFLEVIARHPEASQTLLVEIIGAGPEASRRRDQIMQAFADLLERDNAAAAGEGTIRRYATPHDAFAVVGAIVELASRQVRLGEPADIRELEPVIERLIFGVLDRAR
jgi:AcrR family transcriptional regulator